MASDIHDYTNDYNSVDFQYRHFSPWRPSVWHLWLAAPVAVAVAVVLTFYAVL